MALTDIPRPEKEPELELDFSPQLASASDVARVVQLACGDIDEYASRKHRNGASFLLYLDRELSGIPATLPPGEEEA